MSATPQVFGIQDGVVLILDFLILDKQTAAAKSHGIERRTAAINQPR